MLLGFFIIKIFNVSMCNLLTVKSKEHAHTIDVHWHPNLTETSENVISVLSHSKIVQRRTIKYIDEGTFLLIIKKILKRKHTEQH